MSACQRCGAALPVRSRAKYCRDAGVCKQAAYRDRKNVVDLPVANPAPVVGSSVASATRAELADAGVLETPLGQATLALAVRVDNSNAVNGYAALVKEFRDTRAEALKDVDEDHGDALDEIQETALRLLRGA